MKVTAQVITSSGLHITTVQLFSFVPPEYVNGLFKCSGLLFIDYRVQVSTLMTVQTVNHFTPSKQTGCYGTHGSHRSE